MAQYMIDFDHDYNVRKMEWEFENGYISCPDALTKDARYRYHRSFMNQMREHITDVLRKMKALHSHNNKMPLLFIPRMVQPAGNLFSERTFDGAMHIYSGFVAGYSVNKALDLTLLMANGDEITIPGFLQDEKVFGLDHDGAVVI